MNLRLSKIGLTVYCIGDAWHGASIKELLAGITAEQATRYPIADAHSIWEIVHHITCWHRVVKMRLRGEDYDPSDSENWKPVPEVSDQAWEAAKEDLYQSADELILALARVIDLNAPVPGRPFSYSIMLNGLVEHDAYHAGQIAMLRKLL